jgi:hypothetical protein
MRRSKTKPSVIPPMAVPVCLLGEAACEMADALGIPVETAAAHAPGWRSLCTADARAHFAIGRDRGYGAAWDESVYLIVRYDVSDIVRTA